MTLHFYNTLTRQKEPFKPITPSQVKMYTCGPTVYHFVHIGNLRTFMFEDLLRRTLKYFGYKVTQVMNLTDVDDKTIRGAIATNQSLNAFTEKYKNAFFEDLETLKIERVEHYPAATDFIPEMIKMIETLIEKGVAYKGGDGSIYFAISKFPHYGCLSHLKLEDLQAGASERVHADEYEKENVSDFVLWKCYDESRDGNIFWESPFGKGRPGWHLECSAMAMKLLGNTLDIHVGGVDNIFPHHENEIAQSEACSGVHFANLWMHAEHLIVDGKKMSKSLGNFFTLRDLLAKGYSGKELRYMLLHTHYKTQLNFTLAGVDAAKVALLRLSEFIYRLQMAGEGSSGYVDPYLKKAEDEFKVGLADDLNISHSLAALFDLVREVNALIDKKQISKKEIDAVIATLKKFNSVLAILDFEQEAEEIPLDVQDLFKKRQEARKEKNWALSDQLRDQIHSLGFVIEDLPQGARVKKV